jgi:hypothetical protein
MASEGQPDESVARRYAALRPYLDERQRRLLLGAEAAELGRGGIKAVALATGVHPDTVAKGVRELEGGVEPAGRVRAPGGGRKPATENDPGLAPALRTLVDPQTRGDPTSPLVWTTKSTRSLADALAGGGHPVSDRTVARMLRAQGFSLQANAKVTEGRQHVDRDAQFGYLNAAVVEHLAVGAPVVSVDTKKKELVGEFHNGGREYQPQGSPVRVNVHDFPDKELGKAIPYGIYDLAADTGWVNVGTDHDTAAFAVESIRRWWDDAGRAAYPGARRLLITADSGGSNSSRARAWKQELAALALQTGLQITACHFPPGTSKWNKIEHRLFSHITMNWRGRPLTSHEVIVAAIASTTTGTGLTVRAELDTGTYPTGAQITGEQMEALPLRRHDWHGDWNYTLYPAPPARAPAPAPPPGRGERPSWAHPALTGMTASDWGQLTAALAVPYQAQLEAGRHIARGGPPTRRRGGGHPAAMTLTEKTLVTIMRQRLGVPRPVMADLFGVSPNTIATAERQIKPLLERAGHTPAPAAARCTTLAELTAYAASHGMTLTPKTKPAR